MNVKVQVSKLKTSLIPMLKKFIFSFFMNLEHIYNFSTSLCTIQDSQHNKQKCTAYFLFIFCINVKYAQHICSRDNKQSLSNSGDREHDKYSGQLSRSTKLRHFRYFMQEILFLTPKKRDMISSIDFFFEMILLGFKKILICNVHVSILEI